MAHSRIGLSLLFASLIATLRSGLQSILRHATSAGFGRIDASMASNVECFSSRGELCASTDALRMRSRADNVRISERICITPGCNLRRPRRAFVRLAAATKFETNLVVSGSDQANCRSLMPLNQVIPQG